MRPTLPYDVFPTILGYLRYDRNTLFSCILVNRTMSILGVPLLWENPFMSNDSFDTINNYQSALLIRTYLACITEEERKYLINKGVNIRNFRKPIFDYTCFLEEILFCYSLYESILCWILLEYHHYTKKLLIDIKNIHINEYEMQYPLINSLYHMFFKRNKIRSLGISIDTLKVIDSIDQQFFNDINISLTNLTQLVIYLKDDCYDNNDNQQSFDFLLDMIKKWCHNFKHIRISNLLVFNNQKLSKVQEIINQQQNLQKLDLITPKENIVINDTLSNLNGHHNHNYLSEIEIHETDLSDNSILEGLASINSLKSLFLFRCKGISIQNIFILSNSLIILKKLRFISNEFSLGLIISTIGKSLKELITNQLDEESSEFILIHCSNSLTNLEIGINLNVQHIFYNLIKNLKIFHLKINCYKESTGKILNDLGFYLPNSLKYLSLVGLFTYSSFKVEHLENLLLNCNIVLESLEIYGSVNYNLLVVILNYIKNHKYFKSLIIDNLNRKEWKEAEFLLLKDISDYGSKVIFN
ncbi:hypothetical protein C1645_850785 [Glomus cerebriforme]|uniref:F-box domain-containing protein n=1 Tax=Glomus cerebriforme TaxID=658196 RepID=A0A397T3D0_9GLOM|nr:hypothetical protein C1645_850785 [Glomus cerebriforme]